MTESMKPNYELLDPENFGEWLMQERRKRGMSRVQLAEAAGMHVTMIFKYEKDGNSPSLINYTNILAALGLMSVIKECDDEQE